jgi:hypothetical protein
MYNSSGTPIEAAAWIAGGQLLLPYDRSPVADYV